MHNDGPARHWNVSEGDHAGRLLSNVYVETAASKYSSEQALRFVIPSRFEVVTEDVARSAGELSCSRHAWLRIGAGSVVNGDRV